MRYLITLFILNLAILTTTGYGSKLQARTQQIPKYLKTIRLSSNDPYGPLESAIRYQLSLNNINLTYDNIHNIPILKIINVSENTKTVSIYQDGKSTEKQLNLWVNTQIILPNGTVYPINTHVKLSFFDNPLQTLAKDAEKELIKQEMREQSAHQLIRKLLILYSTIQNKYKKSVTIKTQTEVS